jgi:hypothetical protein
MAQTLIQEIPSSWPFHLSQFVEIQASPQVVFDFMDDVHKAGWHMEQSSMPMMGSKMQIETLSKNQTGVGATYRWTGKVLGLPIDFSETVVKWENGRKRIWRTIGVPKIIIIGQYEMSFLVEPTKTGSRLSVSIDYELPKPIFWKFAGWLLAGWYSKWCLGNMCQDAKSGLEK